MDGVLTVNEWQSGGLSRPLADLLPRTDSLVGLRCRDEDLVSYHGQPVTNGRRTAADLTRWA